MLLPTLMRVEFQQDKISLFKKLLSAFKSSVAFKTVDHYQYHTLILRTDHLKLLLHVSIINPLKEYISIQHF